MVWMKRRTWHQLRQIAVTLTISVAIALLAMQTPLWSLSPALASTAVAQAPSTPADTRSSHSFVANAVQRVGNAVVRIDTERTVSTGFGTDPFFDDPFFRRFFGDDRFQQIPREYRQQGQGSGFITDASGIILTNAHVVSGADSVSVTLKDGRTFQGEVRGVDEPSDLAVVIIEGDDLPVAPLGNSSEVEVGDWAIAVGNPLGLDNTVTLGIISTLNRSSAQVGIPDKRLDFIQTDAAINPGNSGGPLLNQDGEVIGINTAIRADAEGIGFAIPIDVAKAIQEPLARGEAIPHPYIGIQMRTLTPDFAQQVNNDPNAAFMLPEVNGVLVMRVLQDSPAAASGIRRGDVITYIDRTAITSAEQLQMTVDRSEIGKPLQLTIIRNNDTQRLAVRPGNLQEARL